MPYIDVSRGRIYYKFTGSGPTVLLIHGTAGGSWVWGDAIQRLGQVGRVLAYDRLGHSRSGKQTSSVTLTDHARDAAELLERLNGSPAIVVGRKRGAAIALELVRLEPAAVRALVLIEPSVVGIDAQMDASLRKLTLSVNESVELRGPGSAGEAIVRHVLGDQVWEQLPDRTKALFAANSEVTSAELNSREVLVKSDDLRRVSQPVLCVANAASPAYVRRTATQLANGLSDGHLCQVEGATMIDVACPCVMSFLAGLVSTRDSARRLPL